MLGAIFEGNGFIVLLVVGAGLLAMLAVYVLLSLATASINPLSRRISRLGSVGEVGYGARDSRISNVLQPLGAYLVPKHEKQRETLRLKLTRAGFRSNAAAINLYATKGMLMLALPVAVLVVLLPMKGIHPAFLAFFVSASSFFGMILPDMLLNRRVNARHREMMNALPDALDLLVSCTEAGLGLNAALQRVSRQLEVSGPLLASELEQVNAEIRGGMDRIAALKNLVHRTGMDELRGLVSLLSQSMRYGSAIADILRVYAEEFRDKRMQRAEEQAAMVGTKLIFPLCFCIFPAFFIVAVGPAVVALASAMTTAF